MKWMVPLLPIAVVAASSLGVRTARAELLTVDRAVQIALKTNTQVVNAEASVLDARSGTLSAYSGVLPRVSASYSRSGTWVDDQAGQRVVGGGLTPPVTTDFEGYGTTPSLSGSWSVLNLSSIASLRSSQSSLRAARLRRNATRQDVALDARRQFYEVVKASQLARVSAEALRLARDDERRVNALFEVGSVSKSDLLKARVRTAQSELDSLTAGHAVTTQRISLASLLGVSEASMGEVDTVLTVETRDYDEAGLLAEAERARPDIQAAEASYNAAKSASTSASFRRLPYVTVSASTDLNTVSTSKITIPGSPATSGRTETDRSTSAAVALNLDVFDLGSIEARSKSARADLIRARESRDALRRNLVGEVHEALLAYREAIERNRVSDRAIESATENVKLTQQKYNVGSATILELIDAQVQLQRAESDQVGARAAIRVAEAQLDRVRGRSE